MRLRHHIDLVALVGKMPLHLVVELREPRLVVPDAHSARELVQDVPAPGEYLEEALVVGRHVAVHEIGLEPDVAPEAAERKEPPLVRVYVPVEPPYSGEVAPPRILPEYVGRICRPCSRRENGGRYPEGAFFNNVSGNIREVSLLEELGKNVRPCAVRHYEYTALEPAHMYISPLSQRFYNASRS